MPGKHYEDLRVGQVIRHALSRTVTEMDNVLFSALTMNTQPLHIDEQFARGTRFGRRVVNGLFTLGLATGMTVPDLTEGTIVANLGYDKVRHTAPVFHGDTLRVETEVLAKRESKSDPTAGLVTLRHTARNQDGAVVLEFERTAIFLRRPVAAPSPASDFAAYFRAHARRGPWPLLRDALARFGAAPAPRQAIDLGFGNGHETLAMLSSGWRVFAIDAHPDAVERLRRAVPEDLAVNLAVVHGSFEDADLPPADLVWAGLSLPFCHPDRFDDVWRRVVGAVRPGGRFAGQFFGPRDAWSGNADMSFHDEGQLEQLLAAFDVEVHKEVERDGPSASGEVKHWHVFSVIARKTGAG